jgi:hypothetical protein
VRGSLERVGSSRASLLYSATTWSGSPLANALFHWSNS